MGNVATKPSPQNLPKPNEGTPLYALLDDAGFVWGEAMDGGITHHVTMPSGWLLQNTDNGTYSDYVVLRLLDPQGKPVARINGKFAAHDTKSEIYACSADEPCVDLSQGVVQDGYFVDRKAAFAKEVRRYRDTCNYYSGRPNDQPRCDEAYAKLCKKAEEMGEDVPVKRVILRDCEMQGLINMRTGLDYE